MGIVAGGDVEEAFLGIDMEYVDVPKKIRITDLLNNRASFSPHNYKKVLLDDKNTKRVRDFLFAEPINGEEVGSDAYIRASNKYFIRNKALQQGSFLLSFVGDSVVPVLPSKFQNLELKEGDLVISKDSNIGETIILDKDYPDHMLSGGLYKLPVGENKYYLFAFLRHDFFRTQLNFLVSKGATIRHAKKLFLDCLIPLPTQVNAHEVINYLEKLTQLVVNKEKQIAAKEKEIYRLIERELLMNQGVRQFKYSFPNIAQVLQTSRIDAGFFCEDYSRKQFLVNNYVHGAGSVEDWRFEIGRGQNLQISAIGNSLYSREKKENFYVLVRPTNLSDFGTVTKYEYLGNAKELAIITEGDIIFSAEGSVGKCVMFANPKQRLITNIHGIILNKKDHNKTESAFVSCFLRYLRQVGILDYVSVGGQGGSLAMKYWAQIKIPFFPEAVQKKIASHYYAPIEYSIKRDDYENIVAFDAALNEKTGILELDEQAKILKGEINTIVDKIIAGKSVEVSFDFLREF